MMLSEIIWPVRKWMYILFLADTFLFVGVEGIDKLSTHLFIKIVTF